MIDVLIQVIREIDDGSDGTSTFDIFIKLLAFNQSVTSRIEKNVTKTSSLI